MTIASRAQSARSPPPAGSAQCPHGAGTRARSDQRLPPARCHGRAARVRGQRRPTAHVHCRPGRRRGANGSSRAATGRRRAAPRSANRARAPACRRSSGILPTAGRDRLPVPCCPRAAGCHFPDRRRAGSRGIRVEEMPVRLRRHLGHPPHHQRRRQAQLLARLDPVRLAREEASYGSLLSTRLLMAGHASWRAGHRGARRLLHRSVRLERLRPCAGHARQPGSAGVPPGRSREERAAGGTADKLQGCPLRER